MKRSGKPRSKKARRYVYFFGDGRADGKDLPREILGGKGYGLVQMTAMGVPVPPGFVISTEVCAKFSKTGQYPPGLKEEVEENLARLEKTTGKVFGDSENPLLVSVRSGAPASMPGMMDTILNLGLTHEAKAGFGHAAGERFARDCRRRLISMYGDVVLKVPKSRFEEAITRAKEKAGVDNDAQLSAQELRALCTKYLTIIRKHSKKPFPEDPRAQLWGAIGAVFQSWDNERARSYRKLNRIPETWGTAVTVQAMVFGNLGDDCATGVAFTRNPATGEKTLYGEFLANAQGEDVVAGIRTPHPISAQGRGDSLEETMPAVYAHLLKVRDALERNFRDMQDIEFTIEGGKLYILQTRNGKRTGFAAVRIACDFFDEKRLSKREALTRVDPEQLSQLLAPVFPTSEKERAIREGNLLARGLPAGPGASCGRAAFSAERAVEMAHAGDPVILVRAETSPEDILGMAASQGILTSRGGMTCVAGETRVLTDRGLLTAEDAFLRLRNGERLRILSFDCRLMQPVWRRIIAAGRRSSEVISVAVSQTGRAFRNVLRLTPDHKMITIRDRKPTKKRLDTVLADEDFVTVVDRVATLPKKDGVSNSLAYVAGAILSDGYVRVSRTKGFVTFIQKPTAEKSAFIGAVEKAFRQAFGIPFSYVRRRRTRGVLRGREILGEVEDRICFRRAPAKVLADIRDHFGTWVLRLGRTELFHLLAGFVDGDGTYSETSSRVRLQISVSHAKRGLLEGLALACLRLGIVPQIVANRENSSLQIAERVDEILAFTHRVKARIPARVYESRCLAVNGLFHDIVDDVNFMGRVRQGMKRNLIFGVSKLRRDVLPLCDRESGGELRSLLDSPVRSYRIRKVGEAESALVYNFEVDARREIDKNFIVFSNRLTPVLVSNSHAAVVARGMGKCCVVGCGEITIDARYARMTARGKLVSEGDFLSVDGTTGEVIAGKLPTRPSEVIQVAVDEKLKPADSRLYRQFARVLEWADEVRRLGVRANADTPRDAHVARAFGAEGIGLCRTEHMFFEGERITAVREMILSETPEGRMKALAKILPMQRGDFVGIFREMGERPVTIRLLDPPLHEFLPREPKALAATAKEMGISIDVLKGKVEGLSEANPMLGHRGCRLGLTHPEIYEIQVRAIFEAAVEVARSGKAPVPEVMIPLVGALPEFTRLREMTDRVAHDVFREAGRRVAYRVGTMIEIPRAALMGAEIGAAADFFSFGTNDLTQMTFGFSRDDIGSFLPQYLEAGILPHDPFATIDVEGVGQLVALGTERGRSAKKKLKVGICGEHGGDPASIRFFHETGLDYVSCSPYRVPIARLAAARAAIAGESLSRTA